MLDYLSDLRTDKAHDNWTLEIMSLCTLSTPVQSRFVVLVTTVDTLVRLPLLESDLGQPLLYINLINHVLRSPHNLIGLSIMDVLLGLIAQTLRVLQLPLTPSPKPTPPRVTRENLLYALKCCIAGLPTHIYYTDQVTDMLSALMIRLKPDTDSPTRDRNGYFSTSISRQVALEFVCDVLKVANATRSTESRNPVPIAIWEGSQWLLSDPSLSVRRTYTEALITWLELETTKTDFQFTHPEPPLRSADTKLARRAASNDRQETNKRQTFLQLLHLANYENALQFAVSSPEDIINLHALLSTLTKHLGVNAVVSGLPMIFTLQEEIARIESPVGKLQIGSLVHGYLWALVDIFSCEHEVAGKAILDEVGRRQGREIWVREIEYPPPKVSIRRTFSLSTIGEEVVGQEDLKPFDDRESLVDSVLRHCESSDGLKEKMMETWSQEECIQDATAPESASVSAFALALAAAADRQMASPRSEGSVSKGSSSQPAKPLPQVGDLKKKLAMGVLATLF